MAPCANSPTTVALQQRSIPEQDSTLTSGCQNLNRRRRCNSDEDDEEEEEDGWCRSEISTNFFRPEVVNAAVARNGCEKWSGMFRSFSSQGSRIVT